VDMFANQNETLENQPYRDQQSALRYVVQRYKHHHSTFRNKR